MRTLEALRRERNRLLQHLNVVKGREWARNRRERTHKLIELGGLVVIAGLHHQPTGILEFLALQIAAEGNGADALRRRTVWAKTGDAAFRAYQDRGRWKTPTETHRIIVMGGILNAASLAEWPAATLLGALVDFASRIKVKPHVQSG